MSKEKIWLSSPHMGDQEQKFVQEAFDTNWIAPLGPHVNGFEQDLQNYTNRTQAAALSSGTAALHLGLQLLGVEKGDIVLCQSFTFCGSANPITYQGAIPVFIDSEAESWNMDPVLLEEAIVDFTSKGQKPKAIVLVHLYGMPAKLNQLLAIAQKFEIPVLEDAAEALGSTYYQKKCGNFGDLSVLSFNGNKIITTSGGGALLGNDEAIIQRARFLATQARDAAPYYEHSTIGYNYRLSNICAAIGRGQMIVLDERVAQRRAVFDRYFEALGSTYAKLTNHNGQWKIESLVKEIFDNEVIQISKIKNQKSKIRGIYFHAESPNTFSNRWLTTILVNPKETGGITREDIRLALEKENIEARPLWKPMHQQPVFKDANSYLNGVSDFLFEYGLCLPSGSNLTPEQQDRVILAIKRCIKVN